MKITSIIFDLDDVIVNSSPLHFEAYERALADFGLPVVEIPAELCRSIYGMRIKEIMHVLVNHFKMDVDVEALTRHRNDYFLKLVKKGVKPMPGLAAFIKNVEKWKMKRAVASSGVTEYVHEVLKQLKINKFFDVVVTGDNVHNPKPAPDCFLLAAKKIDALPSECAVIEDATKGIEAAKAAGMLAIGVKNSVVDSGQDMSRADIVVHRLDEITLEMLEDKR